MYFHVRVTTKSRRTEDEVMLDLTYTDLQSRIITPYTKGSPLFIDGKTIPCNDIEKIKINRTEKSSEELIPEIIAERSKSNVKVLISNEWYVTTKGKDVTNQYISGSPGKADESETGKNDASKENKIVSQIRNILVLLLVYLILGSTLNAYSIVLYDSFEQNFSINPYYPDKELSCLVSNKASLSLPYVNAYYFFNIEMLNGTNTYAWFIGTGGQQRNFTNFYQDIGKINPSESKNVDYYIHLCDESATYSVKIELMILKIIRIPVAQRTYLIKSLGDDFYSIDIVT